MSKSTNIGFGLIALLLTATLAGCAGGNNGATGDETSTAAIYKQAGSSTVLPIAQAWAEDFGGQNRNARFSVSGGGTGAGFQQFCRGEIDIADASRPIKEAETAACTASSITPFEIQVAIDALAVVVSRDNTFADDITTDELYRIFASDATKQANRWNELRPEWPDHAIERYGPGTDSGTFDYFVEVIVQPKEGKESKGRADYTKSEDDNVLVQGISASEYAIGYFGLAYVEENADKIRALPVDTGKGAGAIEPTAANVEAGKYAPLARPIFMYTDGKPAGILLEYFEWGLGDEGQQVVEAVGYIRVPEERREEILASLKG